MSMIGFDERDGSPCTGRRTKELQALLVTMTVQGSVTVSGCHSTDDFLQKKNIHFCPKIVIFTCLTVTDGVCIFKIHVEVSELLFTTTSPRRPRGRV